jgi:hypothetical protein
MSKIKANTIRGGVLATGGVLAVLLMAAGRPARSLLSQEAPSWVRAQQAAAVKEGLIDKLEHAEKQDQATIASIKQRLRVVSERNKWLADKYKALKAYKGLRSVVPCIRQILVVNVLERLTGRSAYVLHREWNQQGPRGRGGRAGTSRATGLSGRSR